MQNTKGVSLTARGAIQHLMGRGCNGIYGPHSVKNHAISNRQITGGAVGVTIDQSVLHKAIVIQNH